MEGSGYSENHMDDSREGNSTIAVQRASLAHTLAIDFSQQNISHTSCSALLKMIPGLCFAR
jgi:hypothetical protein